MNILHLQFDTEIRTLYQVEGADPGSKNEFYLAYSGQDYVTRFGKGDELFKKSIKLPEINLYSVFYLPISLAYNKSLRMLKKFVYDNNIDVIHVHKRTDIQCRLALDAGLPIVIDSHDLACVIEDSSSGSNGYAPFRLPVIGSLAKGIFMKQLRRMEKTSFTSANQILVVSPVMKDYIIRDYQIDPNKITLMPNTVPLSHAYEGERKKLNDPLKILFATSFQLGENASSGRNISNLIEMLGNNSKVDIFLCGKTDPRSRDIMIEYCNKYRNIHYLGFLPPNEYQAIIREYDVGLIFNHTQFDVTIGEMSLPKKLFEYASNGLPIVANRTKQIAMFFQDHQIGVTFDDSSEESFIDAINEIIRKYDEYSTNALKMITIDSNWDKQAKELELIYVNAKIVQ